MAWRQYSFNLNEGEREATEDALISAGALSVTIQAQNDEPVFEVLPEDKPVWQKIKLTALTAAELDQEVFLSKLWAYLGTSLIPTDIEFIDDKAWEREWMDQFEPIPCGNRLWIVPSWRDAPAPDAINLVLDPGLAFGSGTHPTTFMCLKWLDQHINGTETIVDYGCGSGILAIAALLLGAKKALATDIDPQAIIATEANAERNQIETQNLICSIAGEEQCDEPFNIVAANILAKPLIGLKPTLAKLMAPNSRLILSGILQTQAETVITAYADVVSLRIADTKDDWVLLTN